MKLTRADRKILQILQEDGKISNVDLAERVGLSPSPCLRRVKQLEASGLIRGYVALLDRRKAKLDVLAYVEVQVDRHSEEAAEAFQQAVLREPEVVGCYAMTGGYDYLLRVVVPSLDAYADFTMKRLLKMPAVKDVRSSFVLHTIKDQTALPLDYVA
ncbi:Lrp/AsnC family transcriptional regulator [Caulobacter vibrioides]|nr:Lrp/AsnC family transcriptional regulator [Caulobacter vibrioides]